MAQARNYFNPRRSTPTPPAPPRLSPIQREISSSERSSRSYISVSIPSSPTLSSLPADYTKRSTLSRRGAPPYPTASQGRYSSPLPFGDHNLPSYGSNSSGSTVSSPTSPAGPDDAKNTTGSPPSELENIYISNPDHVRVTHVRIALVLAFVLAIGMVGAPFAIGMGDWAILLPAALLFLSPLLVGLGLGSINHPMVPPSTSASDAIRIAAIRAVEFRVKMLCALHIVSIPMIGVYGLTLGSMMLSSCTLIPTDACRLSTSVGIPTCVWAGLLVIAHAVSAYIYGLASSGLSRYLAAASTTTPTSPSSSSTTTGK